ncbi:hypothetical protein M011DRAFT_59934 [Sporormia fimetaria CBS 119925]|uniref:Uncharacterized protein n=1 Tax=Sporormia fimetaria CBS 119925 TaxID=1340428 RepID=A0A6A6V918_9PLEO|nr:hypothetical protein M011DRAFT_59934 [Sporormia fimetaria CBS 119925]
MNNDDVGFEPEEEWQEHIDEWYSKNWDTDDSDSESDEDDHPPEELYLAMKYVQLLYPNTAKYPSTLPHTTPKEKVKTIYAPGDGYTAGLGANMRDDVFWDAGYAWYGGCGRYKFAFPERLRDHSGWKDFQGDEQRRTNFGACAGHTIPAITKYQINLGENLDAHQFKAIGNPHIAVLTAGLWDFGFRNLINDCILGPLGTANCDNTLNDIEGKLNDEHKDENKKQFKRLLAHLVVGGRLATDLEKPEEFQVFVGTYIPPFAETGDDHPCKDVSWNLWGDTIKLHKEFRGRVNAMVNNVNTIIKESADEFKKWGVFYVDSYNEEFKKKNALFCDKVDNVDGWDNYPLQYAFRQNIGNQTRLWSGWSDWTDRGKDGHYQGNPHPIVEREGLEADKTFVTRGREQLMKDMGLSDSEREDLVKGKKNLPDLMNPKITDEREKINDVKALQLFFSRLEPSDDGDVNAIRGLFREDMYLRAFHPKGEAVDWMANSFFKVITDNREKP